MNPRRADSDAFSFLWDAITGSPLVAFAALAVVTAIIAFAIHDVRKS